MQQLQPQTHTYLINSNIIEYLLHEDPSFTFDLRIASPMTESRAIENFRIDFKRKAIKIGASLYNLDDHTDIDKQIENAFSNAGFEPNEIHRCIANYGQSILYPVTHVLLASLRLAGHNSTDSLKYIIPNPEEFVFTILKENNIIIANLSCRRILFKNTNDDTMNISLPGEIVFHYKLREGGGYLLKQENSKEKIKQYGSWQLSPKISCTSDFLQPLIALKISLINPQDYHLLDETIYTQEVIVRVQQCKIEQLEAELKEQKNLLTRISEMLNISTEISSGKNAGPNFFPK